MYDASHEERTLNTSLSQLFVSCHRGCLHDLWRISDCKYRCGGNGNRIVLSRDLPGREGSVLSGLVMSCKRTDHVLGKHFCSGVWDMKVCETNSFK